MALKYSILDVFTSTALTGNPLAVVFQDGSLSGDEMLQIAREFNLSETTFVERRSAALEAAEGVRVRIFTTEEELPFAGHPTLGTATILKLTAPEVLLGDKIRLALNVGTIPVRFEPGTNFGEMTQRAPEFLTAFTSTYEREKICALSGLTLSDLNPQHAPQIVSTGTAFAIVPLASVQALASLNVKDKESSAWLRPQGARWFYFVAPTFATDAHEPIWRARMLFNGTEDPATGSAAGCAISYLVRSGLVESNQRIHLRQGVEMGRPSEIFLTAELNRDSIQKVRVAGSTTLVANGSLFLP